MPPKKNYKLPDLMDDPLIIKLHCRFRLVGLDAPDVEGLLGGQGLHEGVHRVLEDCSGSQRSFRRFGNVVSPFWPH